MVCCVYNEDITWIHNETQQYDKIYIYVKNKKRINKLKKEFLNNKINIILLENIGSCDPVYLYHIINNYNSLEDTITFSSSIKVYKSSQWCILNRKHTQKILENNEILTKILLHWDKSSPNYFFIRGCPDEYSYITLLHHLGLENEIILTHNLSSDATTFTGWKVYPNYKNFSKSKKKGQPNYYSKICKEELDFLINSKSLFGRKFIDGCEGLEHLNIRK